MKHTYEEIRSKLTTGQIVGVRENKSIIHVATKAFTGSRYTHVGIIIVKPCGVYLAELNGGRNHLIPLSQLRYKRFDVYECPKECLPLIEQAINDQLREEIHYSFLAFIFIGIMDLFNVTFKVPLKNDQVCTGFVAKCLNNAGIKEKITMMISPGDLLEKFKFLYQVN